MLFVGMVIYYGYLFVYFVWVMMANMNRLGLRVVVTSVVGLAGIVGSIGYAKSYKGRQKFGGVKD